MLEAIFGNSTAEKVLLYLAKNDQSYAQEITDALGGVPSSETEFPDHFDQLRSSPTEKLFGDRWCDQTKGCKGTR